MTQTIEFERHVIHLVRTFPTGAEEWQCGVCDYRFIAMWPYFIVLEKAADQTLHVTPKALKKIEASESLDEDEEGEQDREEEEVELSPQLIEQLEGLNWDGDDHEA